MKNKEQIISETLVKIGVPTHFKGYVFAKEAVSRAIDDLSVVHHIHSGLYPDIAKKYQTTVSRVERGIRYGLEVAWEKTPQKVLQEVFGPFAVSKRKMTNGQFIATLAERIRLQLMQKAG